VTGQLRTSERLSKERRYLAKVLLSSIPSSWASGENRTVVLCYHSIHPLNRFASATPTQFDRDLHWLVRHCAIVPTEGVRERAVHPDDRPVVALTFDDGYVDNYRYAFPILAQHGVSATFFVTTGFLDRDPRTVLRMSRMRGMAVEPLRWKELLEMRDAGMRIGSHTVTHPNLAALDRPAIDAELRDSKHRLEDELSEEVGTIAYPYGIPGRHIDGRVLDAAASAGYRQGHSILYRSVRSRDDRLSLPRIAVKNNALRVVRAKVEGRLDVIGRWQERRARLAG